MNRFKVKVTGTETSSSRFTARDENEKEAAKLLNQRLNRRLGIPRQAQDRPSHERTTERPSDGQIEPAAADNSPVYNPPLLEGELNEGIDLDAPDSEKINPQGVVTEIQTFVSETTQYFEDREPEVQTVTLTTAVERTLDPTELFPAVHSSRGLEEFHHAPPGIHATPPIVISKTYDVTETTSRLSLVPVAEGSLTTTHTITENFVIRKLITGNK